MDGSASEEANIRSRITPNFGLVIALALQFMIMTAYFHFRGEYGQLTTLDILQFLVSLSIVTGLTFKLTKVTRKNKVYEYVFYYWLCETFIIWPLSNLLLAYTASNTPVMSITDMLIYPAASIVFWLPVCMLVVYVMTKFFPPHQPDSPAASSLRQRKSL